MNKEFNGNGKYPPNLQTLINLVTKNKEHLPEQFKGDVRALMENKTELTPTQLKDWIDAVNSHVGNGEKVSAEVPA